jgi:serine O-acetyltransferase
MTGLYRTIVGDLRRKALWCYDSDRPGALLKVLLTDGTMAMILYRLMQWSHRCRLVPLAMIFNKLNAIWCNCIIGRGAEFGPGFVLVHAMGVVINGRVRGGANVMLYHQVTLGGERDEIPVLGDDVLIGAGAKVIGPVRIGDGARVAANSVVFADVPAHVTVLGIPARPVWSSAPRPGSDAASARPKEPSDEGEKVGSSR